MTKTADKPNARRLGWQIPRSTRPFANRFMRVRHDDVVWPDGQAGTYSYVELDPVVIIVPVTTEGEVVLIREFRYTIDDWVWEVPAGGSHDFAGDDLAELARRELREEVGGEAGTLTWIGWFNPMVGKADAVFNIYLATDVVLGEAAPESGEMIEVHRVAVPKALRMARDGTITSGSCALALLRCEPHLLARA